MTEEEASVVYWAAVSELQKIIESGHRGDKEDILGELAGDLSEE